MEREPGLCTAIRSQQCLPGQQRQQRAAFDLRTSFGDMRLSSSWQWQCADAYMDGETAPSNWMTVTSS